MKPLSPLLSYCSRVKHYLLVHLSSLHWPHSMCDATMETSVMLFVLHKNLPWLSLTKSRCYSDRMNLNDPKPGHWKRWNHKYLLTVSPVRPVCSASGVCLVFPPPWSHVLFIYHIPHLASTDALYETETYSSCLSFLPLFPKCRGIASWHLKILAPIFFPCRAPREERFFSLLTCASPASGP